MRRALAIDEKSYGPDHPDVATDLNNLAGLMQATNRLAEAEPLIAARLPSLWSSRAGRGTRIRIWKMHSRITPFCSPIWARAKRKSKLRAPS